MNPLTLFVGPTGSGKTTKQLELIADLADRGANITYIQPGLYSKSTVQVTRIDRPSIKVFGKDKNDVESAIELFIFHIDKRLKDRAFDKPHLHLAIDNISYVRQLTDSNYDLWQNLQNRLVILGEYNCSFSATSHSRLSHDAKLQQSLIHQFHCISCDRQPTSRQQSPSLTSH